MLRKQAEKRDMPEPAPPLQPKPQQKKKAETDSEKEEKRKIEALPKPKIPEAKVPPPEKEQKVMEKIAEAYKTSGFAAKEVITVPNSSDDDFVEVKSKRTVRAERKAARSRSSSRTRSTSTKSSTTPTSTNKRKQEVLTPRRRGPKYSKMLDINFLQSAHPSGKRNKWSGWHIAFYFYKTQGWISQENLNYFTAYPGAAKHWMERLPLKLYDNGCKWLRLQKEKGTLPRIPPTTSITGDTVATPHPSLNMKTMPASLPLKIDQNKKQDAPKEAQSEIIPVPIEAGKWEDLERHVEDIDKNWIKVSLKADTTDGTKVSDFKIGSEELMSELRDRVTKILGVEVVLYKDTTLLVHGKVTGPANQIVGLDTITIKAYKKMLSNKDPIGHKIPLTIIVGGKSLDEYVLPDETIEEIKERISAKLSTLKENLKLKWQLMEMDESKTVKNYQIGPHSRIYAIISKPKAKETIAESSKPIKETMLPDSPNMSEMEWEDCDDTILLNIGHGEIRSDYKVPLDAQPYDVIKKYARDVRNDVYLKDFDLYKGHFKLSNHMDFSQMMAEKHVMPGDKLTIAPTEPLS